MVSPEGWRGPEQRPNFEEVTVVLHGVLRLDHEEGSMDVRAGQAVVGH
jgi:mannose-6-phosphate isomerase-like protein (cupin superfamily)